MKKKIVPAVQTRLLWLAFLGVATVSLPAHGDYGRQEKAAAPINLLSNASIEEGNASGPDAWQRGAAVAGVTYAWDASVGYLSKHCLCLQKKDDRYFPIAQWSQTVPNKPGTRRLTVSAYVKAHDAQKATLDVQFIGPNNRPLGHKWAAYIGAAHSGDLPANHEWKRYEGTVNIPDGTTQIVIAPQIYGPGVVWFDEISATPVP